MRSIWSGVMGGADLPASDHSAIGAGFFISSIPFRTRMPRSALVTDFVIENPIRGVVGVTPGA